MFAVQRSKSFGGVKNNDIVYESSHNNTNGNTSGESSNGTGSGESHTDTLNGRNTPKTEAGLGLAAAGRRTPNLGSLRFKLDLNIFNYLKHWNCCIRLYKYTGICLIKCNFIRH